MQTMAKWIERRFPYAPPTDEFPMIVERMRGTPALLEEKVRDTHPASLLTTRIDDAWSIKEHVGHLLDLEPLWSGRLGELLAGAEVLRAADMSNRKTKEADHNSRDVADLLAGFRETRGALVERLDALDGDQVAAASRHPRLDQPMRTIDLCLFVAEHDAHHLALITRIQKAAA
jgi:uncharacterized damage-inducible protein DinB